MARRASFGRRRSNGSRNLIWSNVLAQNVLIAAGSTDESIICISTDWSAAVGFERATIIGIRGWLAVQRESAGNGSVWCAILKQAIAETTPDPKIIATYNDEDILWTWGTGFESTSTDQMQTMIDVKVKRKIDVNTKIVLLVGAVGASIRLNSLARGLVLKSA